MPRSCELEASLLFTGPRIGRRFLIRASASFADLQAAFGGENCHLFEFRGSDGRRLAGVPEMDVFDDAPSTPESEATPLSAVFEEGRNPSREYVYDFGDEWRHVVQLVARRDDAERFERRLLEGDRSGPPGGLRRLRAAPSAPRDR
jgi:hypothetical protein